MTPVIFINCTVEPYVDDIMSYLKQYETRTRNTLGRFLGERILLAETGNGRPLIKCSVVIDEIISVTTKEDWDEYLGQTWIPVGSIHDWQPDTKIKWLYHLTDVKPVAEPFRLPTECIRHGRVWAELPDLADVSYWNTGGGVMCYSALYRGMYWVFGNEDCMGAYTVDPMNTVDDEGDLIDPNEFEILTADKFPSWREVIESIHESVCDFYYTNGRADLMRGNRERHDSPVNIV